MQSPKKIQHTVRLIIASRNSKGQPIEIGNNNGKKVICIFFFSQHSALKSRFIPFDIDYLIAENICFDCIIFSSKNWNGNKIQLNRLFNFSNVYLICFCFQNVNEKRKIIRNLCTTKVVNPSVLSESFQ